MDMAIVFGGAIAFVSWALAMNPTSQGDFLIVRILFCLTAILVTGAIFRIQWQTNDHLSGGRIFFIALEGAIIFTILAGALDWVRRKEAAIAPLSATGIQDAPGGKGGNAKVTGKGMAIGGLGGRGGAPGAGAGGEGGSAEVGGDGIAIGGEGGEAG